MLARARRAPGLGTAAIRTRVAEDQPGARPPPRLGHAPYFTVGRACDVLFSSRDEGE